MSYLGIKMSFFQFSLSRFANVINNIQRPFYFQSRQMSRVKKRFTMPPFWLPKKTRVLYPNEITSDNEEFVAQVIKERYESPLKNDFGELGEWKPDSKRCGLITRKIGIYPLWLNDGTKVGTTLLEVLDNHVIKYLSPEELMQNDFKYDMKRPKNPLAALVVGSESADPRLFTKEYFTLFQESGVMPKKRLTKFYITPDARLPLGTPLYASHFKPGEYVDIHGVTIDKGFHGVMKRWGFKGMPKASGVTKSHRRPGFIGGGGARDRVWPGKKMPGHMGRMHRVHRGLLVLRVNTKYNVIWVHGPVPGEVGNHVILYDTLLFHKKLTEKNPPYFPTSFPDDETPENLYYEKIHNFSTPSIIFPPDKK